MTRAGSPISSHRTQKFYMLVGSRDAHKFSEILRISSCSMSVVEAVSLEMKSRDVSYIFFLLMPHVSYSCIILMYYAHVSRWCLMWVISSALLLPPSTREINTGKIQSEPDKFLSLELKSFITGIVLTRCPYYCYSQYYEHINDANKNSFLLWTI